MPLRIEAEELRVTFPRAAEAGGPAPRAIGRQRADVHARDPDAEALPRREVAGEYLELAAPTAARVPATAKLACPCAPATTPGAWRVCFTVAAGTAGTASRGIVGDTKGFRNDPRSH